MYTSIKDCLLQHLAGAPLGDLASLAGKNEGLDQGWSSRVHVGDTPMDIKAALAAGAKALGERACVRACLNRIIMKNWTVYICDEHSRYGNRGGAFVGAYPGALSPKSLFDHLTSDTRVGIYLSSDQ